MPEQKTVALKVALIRALKCYGIAEQLSQADMAVLLGTSQPRISNLYHEKHLKFTLDTLFKWFYTLNIETDINTKGEQLAKDYRTV